MSQRSISFEDLAVGQPLASAGFEVSAQVVADFRRAVQSDADGDLAPSALAALYVRPATLQLTPPPGGIYAGQRYRFQRPVRVGERLRTAGQVENLFVRKGNRFVVVHTTTTDQDGAPVTDAWSTRIWAR